VVTGILTKDNNTTYHLFCHPELNVQYAKLLSFLGRKLH